MVARWLGVPRRNAGGGACLFRAISQVVFGTEAQHSYVRRRVVSYVCSVWNNMLGKENQRWCEWAADSHQRTFADRAEYRRTLLDDAAFGTMTELWAASITFKLPINVWRPAEAGHVCAWSGEPLELLLSQETAHREAAANLLHTGSPASGHWRCVDELRCVVQLSGVADVSQSETTARTGAAQGLAASSAGLIDHTVTATAPCNDERAAHPMQPGDRAATQPTPSCANEPHAEPESAQMKRVASPHISVAQVTAGFSDDAHICVDLASSAASVWCCQVLPKPQACMVPQGRLHKLANSFVRMKAPRKLCKVKSQPAWTRWGLAKFSRKLDWIVCELTRRGKACKPVRTKPAALTCHPPLQDVFVRPAPSNASGFITLSRTAMLRLCQSRFSHHQRKCGSSQLQSRRFSIFLAGKKGTIEVDDGWTVGDVSLKLGIPLAHMYLVYKSRVAADPSMLLTDMGIGPGSTVDVRLRGRGAGPKVNRGDMPASSKLTSIRWDLLPSDDGDTSEEEPQADGVPLQVDLSLQLLTVHEPAAAMSAASKEVNMEESHTDNHDTGVQAVSRVVPPPPPTGAALLLAAADAGAQATTQQLPPRAPATAPPPGFLTAQYQPTHATDGTPAGHPTFSAQQHHHQHQHPQGGASGSPHATVAKLPHDSPSAFGSVVQQPLVVPSPEWARRGIENRTTTWRSSDGGGAGAPTELPAGAPFQQTAPPSPVDPNIDDMWSYTVLGNFVLRREEDPIWSFGDYTAFFSTLLRELKDLKKHARIGWPFMQFTRSVGEGELWQPEKLSSLYDDLECVMTKVQYCINEGAHFARRALDELQLSARKLGEGFAKVVYAGERRHFTDEWKFRRIVKSLASSEMKHALHGLRIAGNTGAHTRVVPEQSTPAALSAVESQRLHGNMVLILCQYTHNACREFTKWTPLHKVALVTAGMSFHNPTAAAEEGQVATVDGNTLAPDAIRPALSALPELLRAHALLLSLFPGTFSISGASTMLDVPEHEVQTLLDFMLEGKFATREEDSDDVFCLHGLVRLFARDMLFDQQSTADKERVQLARVRLVQMTHEFVVSQTSNYWWSPKTSYQLLKTREPDVTEVLRLPSSDPDLAKQPHVRAHCVALLRLLHYVDVYNAGQIREVAYAWWKLCCSAAEPWGAATCVAVWALCREADCASLELALHAATQCLRDTPQPDTDEQRLIMTLLLRAKGLVLRDLQRLDLSIADLKLALAMADSAGQSATELATAEHIITRFELAGALDYKADMVDYSSIPGKALLEEGALHAQDALNLVADMLHDKGIGHPLRAQCLTTNSFFQKASGITEELLKAVKANEDGLAIRLSVFGRRHVDVAVSYQQKALALVKLGRYPEAKGCYAETLDIREQVLGGDHIMVSNTKLAMGDMVMNHRKKLIDDKVPVPDSMLQQAELHYQGALRIREKKHHAVHANLEKVRKQLGICVNAQLHA